MRKNRIIARRRLLQTLALSGGFGKAGSGQETKLALDALRGVLRVHGTSLSDTRLQIIKPALERRLYELEALRAFEIDDTIGPTQGILR